MKDWVYSPQVFFLYIEQNLLEHRWQHLTISKPSVYQLGFFVASIGSCFSLTSAERDLLAGCQEAHLFAEKPRDPVNWQERRQFQAGGTTAKVILQK